jgi:CheY-like chemotaxis protein
MARILIADDDPDVREWLHDVLGSAEHELLLAADGRQALEVVRRAKPDLVLLDILMPEADGIEVLGQLQKKGAVPVIAMSGAPAEFKLLEVAECLGASRTLSKPFQSSDLIKVVENVLTQNGMPGGTRDPMPPLHDCHGPVQKSSPNCPGQ